MTDSVVPTRKNLRLKDYDCNGNGCYFVIVGAGLRARPQAAIVLTPLGREVEKSIGYINTHYKDIDV